VHEIIAANDACYYFPAYEIVNDELRDYRFFKEDLVHPNEQAIQYVWEKFTETFFSEGTGLVYRRIKEIRTAFKHKPFHPDIDSYKAFKKKYLEKVLKLHEELSFLDLKEERNHFEI
ncbi:MAG TPA: GSCFA domain-containing protein, partial [Nitrosopumilaceae archaeon]|nr:GSCFA domain-containing protein [Nitrosopumilaceae archaeon]